MSAQVKQPTVRCTRRSNLKPIVTDISENKRKHLEVLAKALGLTVKKLQQMGAEDKRKREDARIEKDRQNIAFSRYQRDLPVKKEKQWRLISY